MIYCHKKGVVHRDIKLENLLFTSKDESERIIKLTDFGLSRQLTPWSTASEICGTLTYMAPEVLMEIPYSFACDFWSIGIVMFILLTGLAPFYNEDECKMQVDICTGKFDETTK